jgi:hypothetical protein
MKNFSADYFFETPLSIVNTLKKMPVAAKSDSKPEVRFFPEGGNMVAGLPVKIAFEVKDAYGNGIAGSGQIVDETNNTVASFRTGKFGMGNFELVPGKGKKYRALVQTTSGENLTKDLPSVYEKGYVMRLSPEGSDQLKITVRTSNVYDEQLFLFVHTRQVTKAAQLKNIVEGVAEFIIDRKQLEKGISHFTVFNQKRQPVCERLFFVRPESKLQLSATADKNEYRLREKTQLSIATNPGDLAAQLPSLSLSVFKLDSLQKVPDADIQSYLWLESDLAGKIESPAYYLNSRDADLAETTDNLMLTHGWSRFKWEEVLSANKPVFEFLPEYEGMLVRGKITDRSTGLPAGNIPAFLSVTGERFVFKSGTGDQNGNVFFGLNNFYGSNEIILQARDKSKNTYQVQVPSAFAPDFSSRVAEPLPSLLTLADQINERSIATQVENSYGTEYKQRFSVPFTPDSTSFFGKAGKSYLLDDYTRFITMEEVLREYVAEVRLRKQQDNFIFKVRDQARGVFFENDPLVLIDGVPLFDLDRLMSYDPLKIRKLDVVTQRYFSGNETFDGIVSFNTYKGNLDGYELDPNALIIEYPGLQLNREFYSPQYDSKEKTESRLPDFRSVLYWSPEIKLDSAGHASINFYTSDRPGRYMAFIQGLDRKGAAGSSFVYFDVKK